MEEISIKETDSAVDRWFVVYISDKPFATVFQAKTETSALLIPCLYAYAIDEALLARAEVCAKALPIAVTKLREWTTEYKLQETAPTKPA